MHFYAWKKGLKTGMYYLRTRAAANAIQFTVDKKLQDEAKAANKAAAATASSLKSALAPAKSLSPMNDITNVSDGMSKLAANASVLSISSSTTSTISTAPLSHQNEGTGEAVLTFEEAKKRAEERELEQAALMCSLENPGACTMCSG